MDQCLAHSGHETRLKNIEEDMGDLKQGTLRAHQRIDGIKNWVIAGMTSLVLQLLVLVGMFFMKSGN